MSSGILNKIIEKSKQKHKQTEKILNQKISYKINFLKKSKQNQMTVSNEKKLLLVGDYKLYGIYQNHTQLWIWASSIPGVEKSHIKNINRLKQAVYLFESESDEQINFYYQLLSQDVILIPDKELLDWIVDLVLFLSDDLILFTPSNSNDDIQFIGLSKINEKYI